MGLTKKEYGQLKVVLAGISWEGGERMFYELPLKLKEHEVGLLVSKYLEGGNHDYLEKAASLMTMGSDNPWLFLIK